jgi:hypothetical protein
MNIQEIIVITLFAVAVFYIAKLVYKNLKSEKGCPSNCKCGVDFSKIKIPEAKD